MRPGRWMVVALAVAAPAAAHGVLERSEPRAGATLRTAPAQVRLWFTGAIESAYSGVEVRDAAGRRVEAGAAVTATRAGLAVPLPALPPGRYRVRWRVLSVDGHVTEGAFDFRVAP